MVAGLCGCSMIGNAPARAHEEVALFRQIESAAWEEVFVDTCTNRWEDRWFLDGLKGRVETGPDGMVLSAGPVQGDDAGHVVLWTKEIFEGDVRIDYEYTKLDDTIHNVNILYVLASGSGEGVFDQDIAKWSRLREIPSMRLYFNHMNAYHISYAAYDQDNEDPVDDYIRSRRYLPETGRGLQGTDLKPDYLQTGLFETGVPHRITAIKSGDDLFMYVRNEDQDLLCHWKTDAFPPVTPGRIGLRHMYTRSARYRDFRVSVRDEVPVSNP